MSARIRPAAQQDLLDLAERIAETYAPAGQTFLARAAETIDLIATFPGVGAEAPVPDLIDPAIRFFPIRRFRNYLIAFVPRGADVDILRVIDGRRDLGDVDFDAGSTPPGA